MTLFERTKDTAKLRGISLQQTAEMAGLSKNALYNWKTKEPSAVSLKAVADVLGVSVDYLLGKTDETMPAKKSTAETADELLKRSVMAFQGGVVSEERAKQIADAIRPMVEMMVEAEDAKENGKR